MEKIKNMKDLEFHVRVPRGVSKEELLKAMMEEVERKMEFEFESADERIRSALLRGFNSMLVNHPIRTFYGEPVKDIIAYLEKQKDVSKAIEVVDRIDRYIDAHTANAHDMDDCNPGKKYYCGVDDTLSNIAGILNGVYSEEKQKEQKPVEYLDKDKVYAIMKKLHDLSFSPQIPINSDEFKKINEITSDVRSLLDYLIEQKPAEWSEEDEKIRKTLLDYYEAALDIYTCVEWLNGITYGELCDWLKSLKNRGNFPKSNTNSPSLFEP